MDLQFGKLVIEKFFLLTLQAYKVHLLRIYEAKFLRIMGKKNPF